MPSESARKIVLAIYLVNVVINLISFIWLEKTYGYFNAVCGWTAASFAQWILMGADGNARIRSACCVHRFTPKRKGC